MSHSPDWMRRSLLTSAIATCTTIILGMVTKKTQAQSRDRYSRGLETLKQVGGQDYDRAIRPLEAFSPDLARMVVEQGYGDVMSRPGLDLKQRQIANVAALTAIGSVRPALKFHIHGMLNVGCTPQEVVETILHAVVYAGFPAAQDGMTIAREVFKEQNLQYQPVSARPEGDRYQLGIQNLQQTEGEQIFTDLKQRGIPAASPQPDLASRRQAESNEVRYQRGLNALNQISKSSGEAVTLET
jgi:4-carboxymuconolactone decarboxylase